MDVSYERIIASDPFKFLVGPDRKALTIHTALLAHHSKPLGVLVTGPMSEAREGCAVLEHVDEQTFCRFSQYAYTGDYIAANPEIVLDCTMIGHTEASVESPKSEESVAGPKGIALWDSFETRTYPILVPIFQPRKNREACEDYTEVFLSHAKLYAFADKYDIQPLRRLSLHKLHRTLDKFILYKERVGDIVDLISYSYANTADCVEHMDDLRELVVHYAACVVEDVAHNARFRTLLEEVGSFARDLVGQMLKRLD